MKFTIELHKDDFDNWHRLFQALQSIADNPNDYHASNIDGELGRFLELLDASGFRKQYGKSCAHFESVMKEHGNYQAHVQGCLTRCDFELQNLLRVMECVCLIAKNGHPETGVIKFNEEKSMWTPPT